MIICMPKRTWKIKISPDLVGLEFDAYIFHPSKLVNKGYDMRHKNNF